MDEETVVCANIEKLTNLLNHELGKAHMLGLKVLVASNDALIMMTPQPRHISIRVWRETVLVVVGVGQRQGAETETLRP